MQGIARKRNVKKGTAPFKEAVPFLWQSRLVFVGAVKNHHVFSQLQNGDQCGGYVSQSSSTQNLARSSLLVIADEAHFYHELFRTAAGVEFHWQRDQLKRYGSGEEDDPDQQKARHFEKETGQEKQRCNARHQIHYGKDTVARYQHRIGNLVLDRMTHFVTSNGKGSDRVSEVNRIRKTDDAGNRIVVIGQCARDVLHGDIGQSVCVQHAAGSFCSAHTGGSRYIRKFLKRSFYTKLGPER